MPRAYRYRVVDVFTLTPLEGNPLAVFPDASDLGDIEMQKIARELNLSETTFIQPPTDPNCAARVRIFTPTKEMIFAGHPTVGSSFVLLDEGIVSRDLDRFLLEEKVGPVPVRVEPGDRPMIWLTTPPIEYGPNFEAALCARSLGLRASDLIDAEPQILSAGNPALFVALKSKDAVDRASLDLAGMQMLRTPDHEPFCVFVFTPTSEGAYSRMFAPEYGIVEDPATGSATGPLAAFMMRHKLTSGAAGSRFVSEQGTKMGRRSILHVQIHGDLGADGIDVGGYVTPLVDATMTL
jgi:trans-2,3-dihydro-3-hydroxyanthranilate isomerase